MKRKAFLAAFPYTIPIFAGFWLLGLTYGIYMNVSGFSFWYPMLMSLTIFGGSLGWKKPYLIFGMCDETFSINCTANIPADVNRGWFYFFARCSTISTGSAEQPSAVWWAVCFSSIQMVWIL